MARWALALSIVVTAVARGTKSILDSHRADAVPSHAFRVIYIRATRVCFPKLVFGEDGCGKSWCKVRVAGGRVVYQTHGEWAESIIWLRNRSQKSRKIGGVNYLVAESISRSRFFC